MEIKLEFMIGMVLQLAGLVLLALYFGRRVTSEPQTSARASSAIAGTALALAGTVLQIVAASQ